MNSLSMKITNLMIINDIASEAQLAKCVGVAQPTLHRILAGKTLKPNQEIIKKIAEFFDVSVDHLLLDNSLENVYIPDAERHHDSPSSVLRYLMKDVGNISEGELSRRTGVPQPTIHRILSGMTPNPRIESIEPLAEFFNITPDQMLGRVSLPKDRIPGSFAATAATKKVVPLLSSIEVSYWPDIIKDPNFKNERCWITSESGVKDTAFALKIDSNDYLPDFRQGTIIIIDYTRTPKEGDFILGIFIKNNLAILGQFAIESDQAIFIPLSQKKESFRIGEEIRLCGIIAEAKHSFI